MNSMTRTFQESEIKRVVVLGPESTGKSELSEFLATEFSTLWVREYARDYLEHLPVSYTRSDLLHIAKGQIALEDDCALRAKRVLICDTNLYVIKIWSEFKYGFCDPIILDSIATRKYDLYLLTNIDVPWEPDPLREHPAQREVLYELYLKEMRNQPVPFTEITGTRENRRRLAVESVKRLLMPET